MHVIGTLYQSCCSLVFISSQHELQAVDSSHLQGLRWSLHQQSLTDLNDRAFNAKLLGFSKVGMIYEAVDDGKRPERLDKILNKHLLYCVDVQICFPLILRCHIWSLDNDKSKAERLLPYQNQSTAAVSVNYILLGCSVLCSRCFQRVDWAELGH